MSHLFYFGKIPARGDFVKGSHGAAVIQQLDTWVTRGLELMLDDPDWKRRYDEAPPIAFLFAGTRSRHMIAGRLVTSHDASQRRYPLLMGTLAPIDEPLQFIARAPLTLFEAWSLLASLQAQAIDVDHAQSALAGLESVDAPIGDVHTAARELRGFVERSTLADVERLFDTGESRIDLRRSLLALGILLQPLLTQAQPEVGKSLCCPLPDEPQAAVLMAAFWLDLVTPFLTRVNLELGILHARTARGPVQTISFGGAQPRVLETIWRQDPDHDHAIDIRDVDWVEDHVAGAPDLGKLASYLEHPTLSLARATRTFRETFLGQ